MLPEFLYRVTFKGNDTKLSFREKGGGTFATLRAAEERVADIRKKHPNADINIYYTRCDWQEI